MSIFHHFSIFFRFFQDAVSLERVEPICRSRGLFFLIESTACGILEAAAAPGIRIIAYFSRNEQPAGQ